MFVPDLKTFPQGVPEVSRRHELGWMYGQPDNVMPLSMAVMAGGIIELTTAQDPLAVLITRERLC